MEDFSNIPWFSLILSLVYQKNLSMGKTFPEEAIFKIQDFLRKNTFSWRIIEFLNNLFEVFFSKICFKKFESFWALSFFNLEFFSKCPKKPDLWHFRETRIFPPKNEISEETKAIWKKNLLQFFIP